MRFRLIRLALLSALLIVFPVIVFPALAQEHPEHPEHPEASAEVDLDALEDSIEAEIAEMAGDDGWLEIEDEVAGKTWTLELDKVHRERLSLIAPDVYFACVDFDSSDGEKVDVDFFMKGETAGELEMDDLSIHKVNGVPRYNWREENGFWKRVEIDS